MRMKTKLQCKRVRDYKKKHSRQSPVVKSIVKSSGDFLSGGPIPMRPPRSSYFLSPGRSPIIQVNPGHFIQGIIPRANIVAPSTLEDNTEAYQTFLGRRQPGVLGGGQLNKKAFSTTIGTIQNNKQTQTEKSDPTNIKILGYDAGTVSSINKIQNKSSNSAPPGIRYKSFLTPTSAGNVVGSRLTDNALFENVQPRSLVNSFDSTNDPVSNQTVIEDDESLIDMPSMPLQTKSIDQAIHQKALAKSLTISKKALPKTLVNVTTGISKATRPGARNIQTYKSPDARTRFK